MSRKYADKAEVYLKSVPNNHPHRSYMVVGMPAIVVEAKSSTKAVDGSTQYFYTIKAKDEKKKYLEFGGIPEECLGA